MRTRNQQIKDLVKRVPKAVELYDVWRLILAEPLNRGQRISLLLRYFQWFYVDRPRKKQAIVTLQNGLRSIVYPDSDSGEANIFTVNVDYHENAFVRQQIAPGDFIVDAGCNVGNRTLVLADIIGGALLIDANPACLERLKGNFKLNDVDLSGYALVGKAVGEHLGEVTFSGIGGTSTRNRIVDSKDSSSRSTTVELTTIDHELQKLGNPRCSYVKLDLEGHDFQGLLGAVNTIESEYMKLVKFERWPTVELAPIAKFFAERGWLLFTLASDGTPCREEGAIQSSFNLMAMPVALAENRLNF